MNFIKKITNLYKNGHKIFINNLSIDCVIFGFYENELKVLLLKTKFTNTWALPGGFVLKKEHLNDAAKRILQERTGVDNIYMEQFYVFSEPDRSTKKNNQQLLKNLGINIKNSWLFDRFVTVGYTALVNFNKVIPKVDDFSSACTWHSIHNIQPMILDHNLILKKALGDLQLQLNYKPIGYNLLPEKFTMPQLLKLYETILNKKLDRRNFQRKIIGTKILKKLNETKKGVAHKAPFLYKFYIKNYKSALKLGMGFEL